MNKNFTFYNWGPIQGQYPGNNPGDAEDQNGVDHMQGKCFTFRLYEKRFRAQNLQCREET